MVYWHRLFFADTTNTAYPCIYYIDIMIRVSRFIYYLLPFFYPLFYLQSQKLFLPCFTLVFYLDISFPKIPSSTTVRISLLFFSLTVHSQVGKSNSSTSWTFTGYFRSIMFRMAFLFSFLPPIPRKS